MNMEETRLAKILIPNYYELLDIGLTADEDEIRRAYQNAKQLYSKDSLAAYGLYSAAELELISTRVEEAFRILLTPEKRKEYNETMLSGPEKKSGGVSFKLQAIGRENENSNESIIDRPRSQREEQPPPEDFESFDAEEIDEFEEDGAPEAAIINTLSEAAHHAAPELPAGLEISGEQLQGMREQLGISLDEIAEETKISKGNLRYIENEDWTKLPAPVYIRGFLTAYAKALKIDPKRVVSDMMKRYETYRREKNFDM